MAVLFVFGCGHVNIKKRAVSDTSAKQAKPFKTPDSLHVEQEENAEANTADSVQLVSAMGEILKYADQHKSEKSYTRDLKVPGCPRISVKLTFGNLFDGAKKHLVVRRAASGEITNIDIFLLGNSGFKRVCTDTLIVPSYMDDTIRDVNGDHQKDFGSLVPAIRLLRSGHMRCLPLQTWKGPVFKVTISVYQSRFFALAKKLFVDFTYGHHPALYKYRWDGLKVDTLGFIVLDTALKKFRVFKHEDDAENFYDAESGHKKQGRIITKLPLEYERDFKEFGE